MEAVKPQVQPGVTVYDTLTVFSVYLFVLGIGGMLAPDLIIGAVGMVPTHEIWGRVAALLVFNLAILYVWIIRTRSAAMIGFTVVTRMIVLVVLTLFVLTGLAPTNIIAFGVVDALGGLWTLWALRLDARVGRARPGSERA